VQSRWSLRCCCHAKQVLACTCRGDPHPDSNEASASVKLARTVVTLLNTRARLPDHGDEVSRLLHILGLDRRSGHPRYAAAGIR